VWRQAEHSALWSARAGGGVQRGLARAQAGEPDIHKGAERRQGLLPLALAALEAALRRMPDALAALDRRAADAFARQARIPSPGAP